MTIKYLFLQNNCRTDEILVFMEKDNKQQNMTKTPQEKTSINEQAYSNSDMFIASFVFIGILCNIILWNSLPHYSAIYMCWFVYFTVLIILFRYYLFR